MKKKIQTADFTIAVGPACLPTQYSGVNGVHGAAPEKIPKESVQVGTGKTATEGTYHGKKMTTDFRNTQVVQAISFIARDVINISPRNLRSENLFASSLLPPLRKTIFALLPALEPAPQIAG